MIIMFCKKCGSQIPDGVKFCTRCGATVTPPAAPGPNPNMYRNPNPGPNPNMYNNPNPNMYNRPNPNQRPNPYPNPRPNPNQMGANGPFHGYNGRGLNIPTPSFLRGGSKITWLAVMFLLSAATMFCMVLSGIAASSMGFGMSLPFTTLSPLMGDMAGSFGTYTVFLVIYMIVNVCAVYLIFDRNQYGTIAGLAANLIAVIFSIVVICASFGLSAKLDAGEMVSTYPTIWTWLALIFGLADGAFLVFKGRELTA